MEQIAPEELKRWLDDAGRARPVLLDVREDWEYEICAILESIHMPMNTVPARVAELDPNTPMVVICHHGGRSLQVARFLAQRGFASVYNLAGGVHMWAQRIDPSMPTY